MRRLFLGILIALASGAVFVWSVSADPGYVLIAWGSKTIEMSVWTAIIIFFSSAWLLYFVLRVWRRTWHLPRFIGGWFDSRNLRLNHNRTTRGMIAFIEGHWRRARKLLVKVAEGSDSPLLYYLMAARSSHQLGETKEMEYYLRRAAESTDGADLAVGLTQAEMQLADGQLEQCLATLIRVRGVSAEHPGALKLLVSVYRGLGDWEQLRQLLPALKNADILSEADFAKLQIEVYPQVIVAAAAREDSVVEIEASWQLVPKPLRTNGALVKAYATALINAGSDDKAEAALHSALRKNWDEELIRLYGLVLTSNPQKQLIVCEAWLRERNSNAPLLLALGRLSLANELWGKARDYFEASLSFNATAEVYAELGRLTAHLGETEKSVCYFQQGLLNSTHELPKLPMPQAAKRR
ncbi:MAG: HemY protein [Pseudomonadales bacterium]